MKIKNLFDKKNAGSLTKYAEPKSKISINKRISNELVMIRCKRERPEMIFKCIMGLLESVDVRVTGLSNTANHLTIKHLEHEQTHQKYKEWLRRNDINYKILEIRQLCGFSKNRDTVLRGTPDGEESFPT